MYRFAWIKPDAVAADKVDAIIQRIQMEGYATMCHVYGLVIDAEIECQ
jgi:nucleoside diphosphate kinase